MHRRSRLLPAIIFPSLLVACVLNNVRALPSGSFVAEGRTIVAYGVGVEGNWSTPFFSVQLDEYNLETQATAGNCFRFNRMNATVLPTPGSIRYFVFDAPPGAYVYSAFHTVRLTCTTQCGTQVFEAPEGRIVYIGDFIYSRDDSVAFRRDLEAFNKARGKSLPDLRGEVVLAKMTPAQRPGLFLCSP
jgi:hypothetical protein